MMTRAQEVAIATAVQQLRPDWDHPGIVAALRAAQAHGTPAEVAAAAGRLASNLKLRNPGMLSQPGAHWRAPAEGGPTVSVVVTRCGVEGHEHLPAARCPACEEANRGEVDHQAGVALVKAALAKAPRYVEPAVKASRAAERRGA
jgi:DNA-binding transcriptional regulator YdaS (Cro superfamily)